MMRVSPTATAAPEAAARWMWDRVRAQGAVGQEEAVRYIAARVGTHLVHQTARGGSLSYPVKKAFAALHGGRARFVTDRGGRRWVLVAEGDEVRHPPVAA